MAGNVTKVIARAYHVAHVHGDQMSALAELKAALASDEGLKTAALAERNRLAEFMGSIRGQGRGACHISKATFSLLNDALR